MITFTRYYSIWDVFSIRFILLRGNLYQSLGELDEALRCYAVASQHSPLQTRLKITAVVSMLFVRIGQGEPINLSKSNKLGRRRESGINEGPIRKDLVTFAKEIIEDCEKSVTPMRMVGMIVEAMAIGEIVRAK